MRRRSCTLLTVLVVLSAGSVVAQEQPLYEGKPLSYWIEQLKNPDNSSTRTAFASFGASALPATAAIAEVLKDQRSVVRLAAIWALGEIAQDGNRRKPIYGKLNHVQRKQLAVAVTPLVGLLDDSALANHAESALNNMSALAVSELMTLAENKSRTVFARANAIRCLGTIGPAAVDSLPLLRKLLAEKTEDALVRGESNAAIKRIERTTG